YSYLHSPAHHPTLHSFPTRRSSDLNRITFPRKANGVLQPSQCGSRRKRNRRVNNDRLILSTDNTWNLHDNCHSEQWNNIALGNSYSYGQPAVTKVDHQTTRFL